MTISRFKPHNLFNTSNMMIIYSLLENRHLGLSMMYNLLKTESICLVKIELEVKGSILCQNMKLKP